MVQKATPRTAPVEISDLLSESASLVQRQIGAIRIVLQLELTPGPPQVPGDAVRLQQVVINMMVNAIQAMAEVEGRMRKLILRSGLDNTGAITVAVQDKGPGISEDTADSLFDAFYALDCGFADQTHLSKLFRRITGSTPNAWRRAFTLAA
jgi:C4-dicarboxylate-specific signal transduction histidine kinase